MVSRGVWRLARADIHTRTHARTHRSHGWWCEPELLATLFFHLKLGKLGNREESAAQCKAVVAEVQKEKTSVTIHPSPWRPESV